MPTSPLLFPEASNEREIHAPAFVAEPERRSRRLDWYGVAFLVTLAFSAGLVTGATMWLLFEIAS